MTQAIRKHAMAEDVPHISQRIVNCLSSVKHFILQRCCCCCFCMKHNDTINYDDRSNFFLNRNDEAIIIRLPARPLYGYNIVDYSDEMIIRNARGRGIWLRPDMPDIVLPEQREPDQPRKKRMFSPNIDADTILQIKKDLEKDEPKAKGGSGKTTSNEAEVNHEQQNSELHQPHYSPVVDNCASVSGVRPSENSIYCTISTADSVNESNSSSSSTDSK